jgi:hypothetical protein
MLQQFLPNGEKVYRAFEFIQVQIGTIQRRVKVCQSELKQLFCMIVRPL